MLEIFFLPGELVMAYPWLLFVPGVAFGIAAVKFRHAAREWRWLGWLIVLGLASLVLIACGILEWQIRSWAATERNPIRLDLFLVVPLLYGAIGCGAVACSILGWQHARGRSSASE